MDGWCAKIIYYIMVGFRRLDYDSIFFFYMTCFNPQPWTITIQVLFGGNWIYCFKPQIGQHATTFDDNIRFWLLFILFRFFRDLSWKLPWTLSWSLPDHRRTERRSGPCYLGARITLHNYTVRVQLYVMTINLLILNLEHGILLVI